MDLRAFSLIVCVVSSGLGVAFAATFDVVSYGAIGDGQKDDSGAFTKAWNAVCGASDRDVPTLNVPEGKTFLLLPVAFNGPCKAKSVKIKLLGSIIAPNTKQGWTYCNKNSWLSFSEITNLIIDGTGEINGRGQIWWNKKKNINKVANGCTKPTGVHFHKCDGLQLSGINFKDSPKNHISLNQINGATISNLHITAPKESPNTDGIDISQSTKLNIRDSFIGTGDDCIAINGGSSFINIAGIACGPGHGISVGSLGKGGMLDTVEEVHVQNCNFNGTQNGVRIKTWPGGAGYARKISFENITFFASENPIIIDQKYDAVPTNGDVKISDVTYSGLQGTSADGKAINLICSPNNGGCTGITMNHINITSSDGKAVTASCTNAYGTATSTAPNVPCLTA